MIDSVRDAAFKDGICGTRIRIRSPDCNISRGDRRGVGRAFLPAFGLVESLPRNDL